MQRVISVQAEFVAMPIGIGTSTSRPWNWTSVWPVWWRWRISSIRARARLPPAESPAKTICSGLTGSWRAPSGGYRRERYARNASSNCDGKGCCGVRRYRTLKARPPLSFASLIAVPRCDFGSIKKYAPPCRYSIVAGVVVSFIIAAYFSSLLICANCLISFSSVHACHSPSTSNTGGTSYSSSPVSFISSILLHSAALIPLALSPSFGAGITASIMI